ncbi:MAG TPA: MBL fold metallo-hydrolase [Micropepsaceae bacterium]|jgi:glyoxylase-like metal-dependent hydrolase (beta-lactamase superfamily II)|nr:MBL fold metallo-hydrolase [Micropepsaceae bacterium]
MKLGYTVALAAAAGLFAASAWAQGQPDFSKVEIKTTPLGHNVYMLEGQGGNMTVAVGNDGVIQVDGEFAPLHDKIAAAVAKVSGGKPVKYLINTHFHGDHTGGNENFAKDGITVVAHKNLAMRLEHGSTNGMSGAKTEPAPKMAIPTKTYTTEGLQLMVDGQTAVVNHPASAHTDTDSYVYFPAANVISTGDVVSTGNRYVTIDYANGGSINGIISTVETYLKLGNDETKYVPGHGELATKADIQKYHDMLVKVRDAVQSEIKGGKTEEQAVADKPLAPIGATLKTNQMADDNMVKMVYRSLKGVKANPA